MEIRSKQIPRVPICCMPSPLPSFQGYFEERGDLKDTSRISPRALLAWAGGRITPATMVSGQELCPCHTPQAGLGKDLPFPGPPFPHVEHEELGDSKSPF